MGALILTIAELVRAEAEAWAREQEYDAETLCLLCPSVSAGCAAAMRSCGLDAEVVLGDHAIEPGHFFVLAAAAVEQPARHATWGPEGEVPAAMLWAQNQATLVDLTATQFEGPRIVALPPGAVGRAEYEIEAFGAHVLREHARLADWPEILDFTVRAVAAVRRAGLATAVELDEEAGA